MANKTPTGSRETTKKKTESPDLKGVISSENETADIDFKDTTPGIKIDDNVLIKVKSNVFGQLVYRNFQTGDRIEWAMCGEAQDVTMADLRAMKASQAAFFRNQWVIILGVAESSECQARPADIYRALGIVKYYENLVDPSNFNDLCSWPENEIAERVSLLTPGAQENLTIALNEYVKRGALDSVRRIRAFEKALGCKLSRPD